MQFAAWFVLVACNGKSDATGTSPDGDADADTDTDSDTDADSDTDVPSCTNPVVDAGPADGAVDVPYGSLVWFTLTDPDPDAVVTVRDPSGAEMDGATTVDGAQVSWTGTLLGSTTYDVTLTHACGTDSVSWTTARGLEGRVYALDLSQGAWIEPANIGAILAAFVSDERLLVGITAVGPSTIDVVGAHADSSVQDLCVPTVEVLQASWDVPNFSIPNLTVPLGVVHEAQIREAVIWGSITADLSRMQDVALEGSIDTRPLVELLDEDGEPDAFCILSQTLGVSCVACPDGSGAFCLDVRIEGIPGPAVPDPIVVRTEADVLADPACEP